MILTQSGGNEGIGFAAPSNIVRTGLRAAAQERTRAAAV
jgi:S1-C subfamily serine protease